jgi:hypothetical protein
MKTKNLALIVLIIFNYSGFAQTNDFRVGISFERAYMWSNNDSTVECVNAGVSETSALINVGGTVYPTSTLNVFAEDGFNTINYFQPGKWRHSELNMYNVLKLIQNNGMKFLGVANEWFIPNSPCPGGSCNGVNIYNNNLTSLGKVNDPSWNDTVDNTKARTNYVLMSQYAFKSNLSDVIWGFDINGEGSFSHDYNVSSTDDCAGGAPVFVKSETPPSNVSDAILYFRNNLLTSNQKICIAPAMHGGTINDFTNDFEYAETHTPQIWQNTLNGSIHDYNPQDYLNLANKPDVIIEGSYYRFPQNDWYTNLYSNLTNNSSSSSGHYLGKFKTIDYLKSKGYNNVQAFSTLELGNNYPDNLTFYHTNNNVKNANWLWFLSYTSIIHGADGVWFFDHFSYDNTAGEIAKHTYMNGYQLDRYTRPYFSNSYNNFTSHLGRELRYLVNKGFLSTDPNTIVYTKKDAVDENCIVPVFSSYIPLKYPSGYGPSPANGTVSLNPDLRSENYGLRYTVRTNGTEVIMIISNPLNIPITDTLEFSNASNPIIQNATGVEVLFELVSSVTSTTYKCNRNSNINLQNSTVGNKYFKPFLTGKKLVLAFGPMDVHVLKFITSSTTINIDGWAKVWSNNGSGTIGGWKANDTDKFISGDFDGDGKGELLCLQAGSLGNWATMLGFDNNNWSPKWSNSGNNSIGGWWINSSDKFVVGDFDGDSSDELLCIQSFASGNWETMLHFSNGTWISGLSNSGNNKIVDWSISSSDKFIVGDFDSDLREELLCIKAYGNSGNLVSMLHFDNGNWIKGWNNSGSLTDWQIRAADRFYTADFMSLSKKNNQLLCVQGDGKLSSLYTFNNNAWEKKWSNNGSSFNGWSTPIPLSDKILVGNIDNNDLRDEIMFIQTGSGDSWSATMDLTQNQNLWNWNWGTNSTKPYIFDWPIASGNGSNSDYLLIKPLVNQPKHLLCKRKFGCNSYIISLYKSSSLKNKSAGVLAGDIEVEAIKTEESMVVKAFPNPTDGMFLVELPPYNESSQLEIYNSLGAVIRQIKINPSKNKKQTISVELNSTPMGVYIVVWKYGNNIISKKVLRKE